MSKRPPIEQRIAADIERGDLRMARDRLISYVNAKGYSTDGVARIARICADMHDPFEAGRYWILSQEEGPQVDRAIAEFVRRSGSDPRRIFAQLPRAALARGFAQLPARVQERLRACGISDKTERARKTAAAARETWHEHALAWIVCICLLASVAWTLFSMIRCAFAG